ALVNGEVVCSTPTTNVNRESPPPFGGNKSDQPQIEPTPATTEEPPDECEPICDGEYCYYPCEDYGDNA
ncbi:MAG: hypothetical protein K8J31_32025, partial [Anaerolineae bacterium]|nr:hypothetical protein [Anaerolineae bacterium]